MRIAGPWFEFDSVPSTQDIALEMLRRGEQVGVVFAHDQTKGRGRFDREWHSEPGDSLTMSLVLGDVPAETPWIIGMAVAVAAAETLDCRLRWPNDLVSGTGERGTGAAGRETDSSLRRRGCSRPGEPPRAGTPEVQVQTKTPALPLSKLGGILTDLSGGFAVVGIGINLNQTAFPPELAAIATSLRRETSVISDARAIAQAIAAAVESFPPPSSWADLAPRWHSRDATPGKLFELPDGSLAKAIRIGPGGELIGEQDGREISVFAANALSDYQIGMDESQ